MFGNNVATSGITFSKILNGISKTLSIANQVIPIYQQAKPMINNAKSIIKVVQDFNPKNKKIDKPKELQNNKIMANSNLTIKNNPIFFQ